jgi:hypothetical protein
LVFTFSSIKKKKKKKKEKRKDNIYNPRNFRNCEIASGRVVVSGIAVPLLFYSRNGIGTLQLLLLLLLLLRLGHQIPKHSPEERE